MDITFGFEKEICIFFALRTKNSSTAHKYPTHLHKYFEKWWHGIYGALPKHTYSKKLRVR